MRVFLFFWCIALGSALPFMSTIVTVGSSVVLRFNLMRLGGSHCLSNGICVDCNTTHCCNLLECYDNLSFSLLLRTTGGYIACRVPLSARVCDFPIVSGVGSAHIHSNGNMVPLVQFSTVYLPELNIMNGTTVFFQLERGLSVIVNMPNSPTDVRYVMDARGMVTVSWKRPTFGNVPIILYRVESLRGTTSTCIASGSDSSCTYSTPFVGGGHQFVVTPVTLLGVGASSVPSFPISADASAPEVSVLGLFVVVSWSASESDMVFNVTAVPFVRAVCEAVSRTSCRFPHIVFDPTKMYQFQVVSLSLSGDVRSVSTLSSAVTLNQQPTISVGTIVGIVVGGTVVLVLAVLAVYLLHRKWTSGSFHKELEQEHGMYYKF